MTSDQWKSTTDPQAMIRCQATRTGSFDLLWEFTVECLRRVYDELPGDAFRRVVRHFESAGVSGIDDLWADLQPLLRKLERRAGKCDGAELMKLNRQIGLGQMVFAFEFQDPEEAAPDVSSRLIAWVAVPNAEREIQANALRQLFGVTQS